VRCWGPNGQPIRMADPTPAHDDAPVLPSIWLSRFVTHVGQFYGSAPARLAILRQDRI